MKTKPIDWKNSSSYVEFLATFQTPHDAQKVMRWSWPTHKLHIEPARIIQQWLQDGILIPATAEEALGKLFQVAQLKTLLKENNLPISGSKSEMIDSLLKHNRLKMDEIITRSQIVKCSDAAIKIITAYKEHVQREKDLAEQKSYDALRTGNYKEACKVFTAYKRQIGDSGYEMYPYTVEEIKAALLSNPEVLSNLRLEELKVIQVVASMKILWGTTPDRWISERFGLPNEKIQNFINYLLVNAKLRSDISHYKTFTKQVRVEFEPGDIDSCSLCLPLDGRIFDIENVPALPIKGCTSFTGCKCTINSTDEDDEFSEFDDDFEGGEYVIDLLSEQSNRQRPVELLRTLKQMLDENLITQAEYDEKKKDLLSRM